MKQTKFKLLIIFVLLLAISGTIFMYLNIIRTFEYPINKACKEIRDFNLKYERFPTINELNSLNVPDVSLVSIREYKIKDDDFLFYVCPSILGPCEVCTKNDGPYFDEI